MPLKSTYGGEAEAEDGKADVVDAKGPGNFAVSCSSTEEPSPADAHVSRRRPARENPDAAGTAARRRPRRRTARRSPGAAAQVVDIMLFLDDYRNVDGVMLPHHWSRSVDGKPTEETAFKTIKLNPAFKPDAFAQK